MGVPGRRRVFAPRGDARWGICMLRQPRHKAFIWLTSREPFQFHRDTMDGLAHSTIATSRDDNGPFHHLTAA